MATPISDQADEARWFFARERRRKLQDLTQFKKAGWVPPQGTPFDFGSIPSSGGLAPNSMTLPAGVELAFINSAAYLSQELGIRDLLTSETFLNPHPIAVGEIWRVNKVFEKDHEITVGRVPGVAAGTMDIYFYGPKDQIKQIGTVTFAA